MKLAAARAIAATIADDELHSEYIIPSVFNRQVVDAVAAGVAAGGDGQRRGTRLARVDRSAPGGAGLISPGSAARRPGLGLVRLARLGEQRAGGGDGSHGGRVDPG